jgi:hypothetical protein
MGLRREFRRPIAGKAGRICRIFVRDKIAVAATESHRRAA